MTQVLQQKFLLLTVQQLGPQLIGMPRPVVCSLVRDGRQEARLSEQGCTFDSRFRLAVETVWQYLGTLLPEHCAELSLELSVKGRGEIGGGSIALPLSLVLLGGLLEQPLADSVYGTGLMGLADGWFTGQLLQDMEAKAQALASMAGRHNGEACLAIPAHRLVPRPAPVDGVRYLPMANLVSAAAELFPRHKDLVKERFWAISTLEQLPLSPAIREAKRSSGAETIALECTSREADGPQEIELIELAWGPVVWVKYPGLPGGGIMVYRFQGEQLRDKEHFGYQEQAREHGHLGPELSYGG